jgi:hypothetical protein
MMSNKNASSAAMVVEMSQLTRLYILYKTNREARFQAIRDFISYRMGSPTESFQQWLRTQDGFDTATDKELDEFKRIIYEMPEGL